MIGVGESRRLTKWLRRHPEIAVVSRDRCGLYAKAARQRAPQALQVADRFHLVQNLPQAIEEQMNLHGRVTGRAILSDADTKSIDIHALPIGQIFTTIHVLREQGLSCSEIERRTGFKRRSVAKWLKFEGPPYRCRATLKPMSPWYFEETLPNAWEKGNRRGRQLFQEIQSQVYKCGYSHLQRLLARWRRAESRIPRSRQERSIISM